jgi:hypothetical protein
MVIRPTASLTADAFLIEWAKKEPAVPPTLPGIGYGVAPLN